jgi:hypothetical protein
MVMIVSGLWLDNMTMAVASFVILAMGRGMVASLAYKTVPVDVSMA